MEKPIVYVETSVVSYHTARPSPDRAVLADQQITRKWWEIAIHRYQLVVSEIVVLEVGRGDPVAASKRSAAIRDLPRLPSDPSIEMITERYMRELPLPETARADSTHLAVASVNGVDYVVTWNCDHLANEIVRGSLARVNGLLGLPTPIILTPREMLETLT